jgi:transposase-like protein
MYSSITCGITPGLARLPRGLALLLMLSLVLQATPGAAPPDPPVWPPLACAPGRWQRLRRRRAGARPPFSFPRDSSLASYGLRLLVREVWLGVLLQTSGAGTLTPWSASLLLLPLAQPVATRWVVHPAWRTRTSTRIERWLPALHRLYQLSVVLLLFASARRCLTDLPWEPGGLVFALGLGTGLVVREATPAIQITTTGQNRYQVDLRGTFSLLWEPRDAFERWLLILFLRKLQGPGQTRPVLSQQEVGAAFGIAQTEVSAWERQVRQHGWHYLSDRFRHALQSLLPEPGLSQAILKVWVPAFWLSAWDVRERLIQRGVLPNRDALAIEALHALAHHTGFHLVRALLLERFDLQGRQLIAREHWWLKNLLALNERLMRKLERGERLTPQELVEIEALRLKTPEKSADSAAPPLAAALKSALFDRPAPSAPPTQVGAAPVRCTYCDSDQVAPKSKTPRLKTILDAFGQPHVLPVLRYYCKNDACPYQSFTHLPPGVLPHSPYPAQVRIHAVEVYVQLLSTYRRSARMFAVKASTVYHWVVSLSPAAFCLAAYLGVVRTSGVVGLDDKWVQVCSPAAVRPHGRRPRARWRYVYCAVDVYSLDLLAIQIYPEHSDQSVRLFLLELKAKGVRPRVVVSDLDPAYGRVLPEVFPGVVHHECIFHAVQNALSQMTKVYGRYYLEQIPETALLHDAITHLFQAQTQKTVRKRYADLMELRANYVTRTPDSACVFDSLEHHFPKLVNAIESADIPRTNNATELVIRRFDQHYQSLCGLDTLESAQVYLRLFELVYRLTPFADDDRPAIRGKSPLELAGYNLAALPIAEFFASLKLPALIVPPQPLSP